MLGWTVQDTKDGQKLVKGRTEKDANIPPTFDRWFAKACSRDPKERFQTAEELAKQLRDALTGNSSVARPPTARRAVLIVVALGIVATIAAAAGFSSRKSSRTALVVPSQTNAGPLVPAGQGPPPPATAANLATPIAGGAATAQGNAQGESSAQVSVGAASVAPKRSAPNSSARTSTVAPSPPKQTTSTQSSAKKSTASNTSSPPSKSKIDIEVF